MQSPDKHSKHLARMAIIGIVTLVIGVLGFRVLAHWIEPGSAGTGDRPADDMHMTIALVNYSPCLAATTDMSKLDSGLRKITKALGRLGTKASYIYTTYEDAKQLLQAERIEGILSYNGHEEQTGDYYLSDTVIEREFIVITLSSKHTTIEQADDMEALKVGIHPYHLAVLAPQLPDTLVEAESFRKISNSVLLASLLFTGEIDAWITHKSVYDYCVGRIPDSTNPTQKVDYHRIFKPIPQNILFKSRELRDSFNNAWIGIN